MAIRQLDWDLYLGKPVRIYRNLNNGTMSIQGRVGKEWRVVGHVTNAVIEQVHFTVNDGGRNRAIASNNKNVHAYGWGTLVAVSDDSLDCPVHLAYDYHRDTTFVEYETKRVIERCKYLVVRDNWVYVSSDALPIAPGSRKLKVPKRSTQIIFPGFNFQLAAA